MAQGRGCHLSLRRYEQSVFKPTLILFEVQSWEDSCEIKQWCMGFLKVILILLILLHLISLLTRDREREREREHLRMCGCVRAHECKRDREERKEIGLGGCRQSKCKKVKLKQSI